MWLLGRRAITDTTVGELTVPAGTSVMVSPYAAHHDPRWFTDPDRVDPDRWAPGRPAPRRHAYLPFGDGIHYCIGERFAWAEASIILTTLTRRVAVPAGTRRQGPPAGRRVAQP